MTLAVLNPVLLFFRQDLQDDQDIFGLSQSSQRTQRGINGRKAQRMRKGGFCWIDDCQLHNCKDISTFSLYETFAKRPPFAQSLRCVQILILEIFNIFLWLKSSRALILNEIEHFSKVSL